MSFLKGVKDQVEVHISVVVAGDLGKKIKVPFKATFQRLSVQDANDVMQKCANEEMTDEDVLRSYLVGWRDLKGANDEEVEFSEDALTEALAVREYRTALIDAYMQVQHGRSFDSKN